MKYRKLMYQIVCNENKANIDNEKYKKIIIMK